MNSPATNLRDLTQVDQQQLARADAIRSVYVYEAPVRLWHWVNALAVLVLAFSGYLIASPLPTPAGEASANFSMGWLRLAHFAAGYILAVGLLARTYWALVGSYYARELYWVPLFQLEYWKDVWAMTKWYAFISPRPGQYIGHNPLARFAMCFFFLVPCVFMVLTGFAMYAEGQQTGGWADGAFGWVAPLLGGSQDVHTLHHLGMWAIGCFVMLHVYAAVREEILGRSSMLSTMISGHRTFKD